MTISAAALARRRGRGLVPHRPRPPAAGSSPRPGRRGRGGAGHRWSAPGRGAGVAAAGAGAPATARVHPFERHTPPPHGGVSSRPPMRRNWSFMSRDSSVRRGNSCGSCPADGGTFVVGGSGVPCGFAAVTGPESNTTSAEPEYGNARQRRDPEERDRGRPSGPGRACPRPARRSCAPSTSAVTGATWWSPSATWNSTSCGGVFGSGRLVMCCA